MSQSEPDNGFDIKFPDGIEIKGTHDKYEMEKAIKNHIKNMLPQITITNTKTKKSFSPTIRIPRIQFGGSLRRGIKDSFTTIPIDYVPRIGGPIFNRLVDIFLGDFLLQNKDWQDHKLEESDFIKNVGAQYMVTERGRSLIEKATKAEKSALYPREILEIFSILDNLPLSWGASSGSPWAEKFAKRWMYFNLIEPKDNLDLSKGYFLTLKGVDIQEYSQEVLKEAFTKRLDSMHRYYTKYGKNLTFDLNDLKKQFERDKLLIALIPKDRWGQILPKISPLSIEYIKSLGGLQHLVSQNS